MTPIDGYNAANKINNNMDVVDIFCSFVDRFMIAAENDSHPLKPDGPCESQDQPFVNPYASLNNGDVTLFNYGFYEEINLEEISGAAKAVQHIHWLNKEHTVAQQPGNAERADDLNLIKSRTEIEMAQLWKNRFPTWLHLSVLALEKRGQHIEKMASLVHETWELCRKMGAGGYLDLIELYQFNVLRSAGPSAHPLLTPHAVGFHGFLESRVRIEQQTSNDLPYFNKRNTDWRTGATKNMTLTGIPVYSVPPSMPTIHAGAATTRDLRRWTEKAPPCWSVTCPSPRCYPLHNKYGPDDASCGVGLVLTNSHKMLEEKCALYDDIQKQASTHRR